MRLYVDKTDVLVGRRNGRLFACNNSCPHRGASLSKGELKAITLSVTCMATNSMFYWEEASEYEIWKKESHWMEQTDAWRESGDYQFIRCRKMTKSILIYLMII